MASEIKRLAQDSFTPLYFQLKEIFLEKIENHELQQIPILSSPIFFAFNPLFACTR
jgi:hypothetical protein